MTVVTPERAGGGQGGGEGRETAARLSTPGRPVGSLRRRYCACGRAGIASAPLDSDADGVADPDDLCPGTSPGQVVDPADGCSIQQLCPCDGPRSENGPWKNHGRYVSCTARTAERFLDLGLIGADAKDKIVSQAARSRCGHR